MDTVNCPICEEKIKLSKKVSFLDRLSCPTCDALLEVINTNPIEIDWIYYDEEFGSAGNTHSTNSNHANCPLCREEIHIGSRLKVGHRLICSGCDAILEIVSIVPLELDWPFGGDYESQYQDYDSYGESYRNNPY
jgi:uncharacterized protein YbaR (Trm112 family)